MRRNCITCGKPTLLAREFDGNKMRVIDAQPADGGPLVVWGDVRGEPTIFWGVDQAWETLPGGRDGIVVPPDAVGYRLHECGGA